MIERVKKALRITTDAYDDEIASLIEAARLDLRIAGVNGIVPETQNALFTRAVITYCRANFGSPADYDRVKAAYDEQKAQLSMASGYTAWGDN